MATKRKAAIAGLDDLGQPDELNDEDAGVGGGGEDAGKPLCKWGPLCYRKNPEHTREFAHPHRAGKTAEQPVTVVRTRTPAKILSPPAFPSVEIAAKKANAATAAAAAAATTPAASSQAKAKSVTRPKHSDSADFLQSCYDTPFPDDLFDLWSVCSELDPDNPREALIPLIGFRLAGPFDALALRGVVDPSNKRAFNLHCRYFYDPPEFQTVLVDVGSDCHVGYFRDDPNELPVFLTQSLLHRKDVQPWKLIILGSNLIQVVHHMIKEQIKKASDEEQRATLEQVLESLSKVSQNKHLLSYKSKRKARAVGNVMHHVGMVVPYNEKTQVGYRPLTVSNVELRRMMQNVATVPSDQVAQALAPIQDIVTLVNFANDECDYGMGLELGLDLFLFGNERLNGTTLFLLHTAYSLLQRPKFFEIVKDHLACRRKEDLDYLSAITSDSTMHHQQIEDQDEVDS